jgi:D-sedoheptulose 7-phosphate isomerase
MDFTGDMRAYMDRLRGAIDGLDLDELNSALNALAAAYERGCAVYIFGNGGSGATASHFVCDFNKGVSSGKPKKFRFVCLNDNIPTLTAIANDIGYEDVFLRQLDGTLAKGDLVIAISGSGNSENVIRAVEYAKGAGAEVIGITGYGGGRLRQLSDYSMHVGIDDMQIAEDMHMVFDHMSMSILGARLR